MFLAVLIVPQICARLLSELAVQSDVWIDRLQWLAGGALLIGLSVSVCGRLARAVLDHRPLVSDRRDSAGGDHRDVLTGIGRMPRDDRRGVSPRQREPRLRMRRPLDGAHEGAARPCGRPHATECRPCSPGGRDGRIVSGAVVGLLIWCRLRPRGVPPRLAADRGSRRRSGRIWRKLGRAGHPRGDLLI